MLASARVGIRAALIAVVCFIACVPAVAEKAYNRESLNESSIRLEAQIKAEAGQVRKAVAELRRDADAAFARNDHRTGIILLGQIVAIAPNDSSNWLRLARAILQVRATTDAERARLLDRASTAAYTAYTRATNRNEETDSLVLLGRTLADRKQW